MMAWGGARVGYGPWNEPLHEGLFGAIPTLMLLLNNGRGTRSALPSPIRGSDAIAGPPNTIP
jgi:hypothetical protein